MTKSAMKREREDEIEETAIGIDQEEMGDQDVEEAGVGQDQLQSTGQSVVGLDPEVAVVNELEIGTVEVVAVKEKDIVMTEERKRMAKDRHRLLNKAFLHSTLRIHIQT